MKVPAPDYANKITISGFPYTTPRDGYVTIRGDIKTNGSAGLCTAKLDITRGGTKYRAFSEGNYYDTSGTHHYYFDIFVPVKSGDKLEMSVSGTLNSWGIREFYPVKW